MNRLTEVIGNSMLGLQIGSGLVGRQEEQIRQPVAISLVQLVEQQQENSLPLPTPPPAPVFVSRALRRAYGATEPFIVFKSEADKAKILEGLQLSFDRQSMRSQSLGAMCSKIQKPVPVKTTALKPTPVFTPRRLLER